MITLRRAGERRHDHRQKQEVWHTFHEEDPSDPLSGGFTTLERLSENLLPPRSGASRSASQGAEIVTYVRLGVITYHDSAGRSGLIHGGEFQKVTAGRGIRRSEANASGTDWAHMFQVRLCSSESEFEPDLEQKRFSVAERRGRLCVFASPDGRRGSLHMQQDALMYSALLDAGQHLVHEVPQGRSVWLHIVEGEVTLSDVVLATGDGAGLWAERAVSVTAREETEILLLNLGEEPPRPDSQTLPVQKPRSLRPARPSLRSNRGTT